MNNIIMYIDPGTGSMLFSVLIGLAAAGVFFLQKAWIKLKFYLSGGRAKDTAGERYAYVIFSDHKRYWNVFRPVCDEFERRKIECEFWTASPDDPALACDYTYVHPKYIGSDNQAFAKLNFMKADICLATTPQLDVLQWKRSRNTKYYVHCYHAVTSNTTYRMFALDYYDAVLLNGAFQEHFIRVLEEKRHLPAKEVRVVGSTYMDDLRARIAEARKDAPRRDAAVKEGDGEADTTVLLAPSWGESSILCRFGEKILDALLATGFRIIVRPHPQSFTADRAVMERLVKAYPDSDRLRWDREVSNFGALSAADIMISDFSGVVFDYVLGFDRPVLYADTSFDVSPYDAAWIDEPFWNLAQMPRLGRQLKEEEFPHLKEIIGELIRSESAAAEREALRDEVWQYPGEAAARTVDYLVEKREKLLSSD